MRAKSIIPTGVFNIESTRVVRSSNDSGLPDDKSQSGSSHGGSKSSSVSSSVSTFSSNGSPRGVNESQVVDVPVNSCRNSGIKTADGSGVVAKNVSANPAQVGADTSKLKQPGADATSKLRSAAKDNAARTLPVTSGNNRGSAGAAPKDKITVHHSDVILAGGGSPSIEPEKTKINPKEDNKRGAVKKSDSFSQRQQTKVETAGVHVTQTVKQSEKPSQKSVIKPTEKPSIQGQSSQASKTSTKQASGQSTGNKTTTTTTTTTPSTTTKTGADTARNPPQRSVSRQDSRVMPKVTPRGAITKGTTPSVSTPRTTAQQKAGLNNKPASNASAITKPVRPPSPLTKVTGTNLNKSVSSGSKKSPPPRPPSPQVGANGNKTVPVNGNNNKVVASSTGSKKSPPPPRPPSPSVAALGVNKPGVSGKTIQTKSTGVKTTSTTIVTMSAAIPTSQTLDSVKKPVSVQPSKETKPSGARPVVPPRKKSVEPVVTPVTPKTCDNPPQDSLTRESQSNPLRKSLSRDSTTRRSQSRLHGNQQRTESDSDNGPLSPTKQAEMTPVTGHSFGETDKVKPAITTERRPSIRQITVQPATDTFNFSTRDPKPSSVEHTGPVIQDPFESLRKEQERLQNQDVDPAAKGGRFVKPKQLTVPKKCGSKSESRLPSAGKKRSKSKDRKTSACADSKTGRPKSSKPKTKAKKKKKGALEKDKSTLSDRADQSNVAFVSGIGWHIETDCYDKTDVQAVVVRSDDSSDSDLENRTKVVPNYYVANPIDPADYIGPVDKLRTSLSSSSLKLSKDLTASLPGQICEVQSGSEDSESESDLSNIEVAEDEVIFLEKLPQEIGGDTPRLSGENQTGGVSQTAKAIDDFSKAVTTEQLDKMLGEDEKKSTKSTASNNIRAQNQGKANMTTTHVVTMTNTPVSETSEPKVSSSMKMTPVERIPSSIKMTPVEKLRKSGSSSSRSERGRGNSKKETEDKKNNNNKTTDPKSATETPRDDAEIDTMIDEIMKATPNPSMTLSWKSLSNNSVKDKKKPTQRSMTREDFENELRKSQGEKTFRQVPNHCTPVTSAGANPKKPSPAASPENSVTLTDSFWSGPNSPKDSHPKDNELEVEDLEDFENKEIMEKLANACRNMELQIKVDTPRSVKGKPPPVPKMAISPTERHSTQPEKSPRFIRKHDSFREIRPHNVSELSRLNLSLEFRRFLFVLS